VDWDLSFLKNPGVWSAVIATVAIVLSQLPPIRQLLAGKKMQLTLRNQLGLSHFLGNLTAQAFIDMENTGGSSLTIRAIECLILGDHQIRRVPVQSYYPRQQQSSPGFQEIPFFPISLKPGEHWAEMARCYQEWSEAQEREISNIIGSMQKDISEKLKHREYAVPPKLEFGPVEVDENLVKRSIIFFEKNFWVDIGNYYFIVASKLDDESAIGIKGFSFTIFESHVNTLRSHIEDYRIGAGVCFPISDQNKNIWVRLKPINDSQAEELYKRGEKVLLT
jgi:hypothetical protein